jgi:hypothetical protein
MSMMRELISEKIDKFQHFFFIMCVEWALTLLVDYARLGFHFCKERRILGQGTGFSCKICLRYPIHQPTVRRSALEVLLSRVQEAQKRLGTIDEAPHGRRNFHGLPPREASAD